MSNRAKYTLGMMLYLFLNSVFFGAVFAGKYILVGLAAAISAQIVGGMMVLLILRTDDKDK